MSVAVQALLHMWNHAYCGVCSCTGASPQVKFDQIWMLIEIWEFEVFQFSMRFCGSTVFSFTKCFLVVRSYLKSLSKRIERVGVDKFSIDAPKLDAAAIDPNHQVSKYGKFGYRSLRIYQIWRIIGIWGFTVFVRGSLRKRSHSITFLSEDMIRSLFFWSLWTVWTS